jgi:hypothetical protein
MAPESTDEAEQAGHTEPEANEGSRDGGATRVIGSVYDARGPAWMSASLADVAGPQRGC